MLIYCCGKVIPYVDSSSFYEGSGQFGFCSRGSKLGSISSRIVVDLVVGSIEGIEGLWKQAIFIFVDIYEDREDVNIW